MTDEALNHHRAINKAGRKARHAAAKGLIAKPDRCQICGEQGQLEAHHFNYAKALEVWWFCKKCHRQVHRIIRSVRTRKYRAY